MFEYILALLTFIGLTVLGTAGWAFMEHIGGGGYPGGTPKKLAARFGLSVIVALASWLLAGIPDVVTLWTLIDTTPVIAVGLIASGYGVLDAFDELVQRRNNNG